jgi:hypothetical protein
MTTTTLHIELNIEGDKTAAAEHVDALLAAIAKTAPNHGARIERTQVDRLRPAAIGSGR